MKKAANPKQKQAKDKKEAMLIKAKLDQRLREKSSIKKLAFIISQLLKGK